ncbi:MAG: LysR family transcriptional regulator [Salinarimonadaceae bacterium]|nr:MAG: LysR family transcriptional regulator [Salinarimonadaceae bacterium]
MMPFDVRQLEVFQAVMEFRSVSRAAQALGVTQPAVSSLIQRLERQLGIVLFNRAKQRLEPTAEALMLIEPVGRALESIGRIRSALSDIQGAETGLLTVAAHPTSGISWLPPLVAAFQASRPNAHIRLITRSSEWLRENAASYASDITIFEAPIETDSVVVRRYKFRCVAVLPPGHPLCGHEVITPALAAGQPFIAMSRWQTTHHLVSRAFVHGGHRWNSVIECELFSTALLLVEHGAGISVVEPVSASGFARSGKVELRRFEPEIRYEVAISHPKGRRMPLIAEKFIIEFDKYIEKYIEK